MTPSKSLPSTDEGQPQRDNSTRRASTGIAPDTPDCAAAADALPSGEGHRQLGEEAGLPLNNPAASASTPDHPAESTRHERIQKAAYLLSAQRGFESGCAVEDWLQAEREIDAADVANGRA